MKKWEGVCLIRDCALCWQYYRSDIIKLTIVCYSLIMIEKKKYLVPAILWETENDHTITCKETLLIQLISIVFFFFFEWTQSFLWCDTFNMSNYRFHLCIFCHPIYLCSSPLKSNCAPLRINTVVSLIWRVKTNNNNSNNNSSDLSIHNSPPNCSQFLHSIMYYLLQHLKIIETSICVQQYDNWQYIKVSGYTRTYILEHMSHNLTKTSWKAQQILYKHE